MTSSSVNLYAQSLESKTMKTNHKSKRLDSKRDVTSSFKESQLAPSQIVRERQRRTINQIVAIMVVVITVSIIAVSL